MSQNLRNAAHDPFHNKGAVEQDRPGQPTNTDGLRGQNDHRDQRPIKKGSDTDFPEPGSSPEYSMQKQENQPEQEDRDSKLHPATDPDGNAKGRLNDQDPGHAQKRNQNDKKDDSLAA